MSASSTADEAGIVRDFVSLIGSDVLPALCLFVALFTVLIAGIEITTKSKSSMGSCINARSLFYLLILFLGNFVAAIVVLLPFADIVMAGRHTWAYAFFGGFGGVFSFEGVLSNTNITIFNRGVLTIADWISHARDGAVAFAVAEEARRNNQKMIENANALAALADAELNAHVTNQLGNNAVVQLEQEAQTAKADHKLYKGLKLAAEKAEYVQSVLKTH